MNGENGSIQRRKYPKDLKGGKSEWSGMVKHFEEINDSLAAVESELRNMRKKDLV